MNPRVDFSKLPKKVQDQLQYSYPGDKFVKRQKYSARSCRCWGKHLHDSILEADYCNELSLLKKTKKISDYTTQHQIAIVVKGKHIANHYVDFMVWFLDGHAEFHETKGMDQDVWKLKKKLVEALFPNIPYVVKREKSKLWKKN